MNNNPHIWEKFFIVKEIHILQIPNLNKKSNFQNTNSTEEFLSIISKRCDKRLSQTLFIKAKDPYFEEEDIEEDDEDSFLE